MVSELESDGTVQRLKAANPVSTRLSAGEFHLYAFDVSEETEFTLKHNQADSSGVAALGIFGPEGTLVDQEFVESDAYSTSVPTEAATRTPTPTETATQTETRTESDDFGEAGCGMGGYRGTQQ